MTQVGFSRIVWTALALASLTLPLVGQNANQAAAPGILGYLDARTGTFHALPPTPADVDEIAAAATTATGKIVTAFTITINSTLPAADKVQCQVTAALADAGSGNFISESAAVAATRSGTSASCTVTIPYSWTLATAATDRVTLTYSIIVPGAGTAATAALPLRISTQSIGSIPVPKTGSTTNETVNATI
jgi:hypothetical protein